MSTAWPFIFRRSPELSRPVHNTYSNVEAITVIDLLSCRHYNIPSPQDPSDNSLYFKRTVVIPDDKKRDRIAKTLLPLYNLSLYDL
jgi:hypothetical protein